MHDKRVEDLSATEIDTLCLAGERITNGPLNATFKVLHRQRSYFVRERLVRDEDYGQTFAGERYIPKDLHQHLFIPDLLNVIHEGNVERFAIFRWIEGALPDWSSYDVLARLAEVLVTVHKHGSTGLGDVGVQLVTTPVPEFISNLLRAEYERLGSYVPPALEACWEEYLQLVSTLFLDERPTLCHGDVHCGNLLWDASGRLWVLDWEAARFRVPAADFNQLQHRWLSEAQQDVVITRYCQETQRDPLLFRAQISALRVLWHVRTFNFQVQVLLARPQDYAYHLDSAASLVGAL